VLFFVFYKINYSLNGVGGLKLHNFTDNSVFEQLILQVLIDFILFSKRLLNRVAITDRPKKALQWGPVLISRMNMRVRFLLGGVCNDFIMYPVGIMNNFLCEFRPVVAGNRRNAVAKIIEIQLKFIPMKR
jgi:hypothetical protein